MQRVMAFQRNAVAALQREAKADPQPKTNGHVKEEPASPTSAIPAQQARTVLTLFGNAPTPRQLFSSFQHSAAAQHVATDGADLELEQLGLPNMLNATKVVPLDPAAALGARPKEPTFADVFPPPANLPPLNPPKPKSTPRSASISWVTGDSVVPKPSRKNAYTMQPLTVGAWLDYGGRDADRESSGAIKRRRRESIVATAPPAKAIQDMSPAEIIAQEEALFKAAYSSFAPSTDNSRAIVPQEIRDRVWWHKIGQKRFDKRFVLDPALENSFPAPVPTEEAVDDSAVTLGSTDEMKEFEAAVENFDEGAFNADSLVIDINDDARTTENMLADISALLETLSSYQRIRNSTIAAAPSRNPTSPSPALALLTGTPTEPTKDETVVYKALRSQLAQMISKLPPYAVAKLDGEQLEDLAVSKTIIIKGKEHKGTMEEDQLTRMIRSSAAIQAAAGPASAARPTTDYKSSSYARTPSVAQPPRSAHAPNPSYYANARTPATSFNRSTVAQSYNTPSATAQRPSYSQASGYANTASRPASYAQTNGQAGYRPGYNNYNTFNAQQTPQQPAPTPGGYNAQQSQFRNSTAYNQNAATATPSYNGQQPSQPRQGYGASTSQFVPPRMNGQPHAPQQMTNSTTQQAPPPQQPNSGRATPNLPQATSAIGPSGFHSSMTSEQQQMMLERQRAQAAQQPLARAQAQADVQRVPSATPQPPQPSASQEQQQQQNGQGGNGRGASATPVVA